MRCTDCSREVRPVLAVDIDGTLGDYHAHWFAFAEDWLGEAGHERAQTYQGDISMADHMGIDKRTYRMIKLAYRQGGMKRSMPRFPGARELLLWLGVENVEIWLTTTRPYLQIGNIDEDTREWLRRNRLPYDHILYDEDKYNALLAHVDRERVVCVLDDQYEPEYRRAIQLGLSPIILRTRYNQRKIDINGPDEMNVAYSLGIAAEMIDKRLQTWREFNGLASAD